MPNGLSVKAALAHVVELREDTAGQRRCYRVMLERAVRQENSLFLDSSLMGNAATWTHTICKTPGGKCASLAVPSPSPKCASSLEHVVNNSFVTVCSGQQLKVNRPHESPGQGI